MTDQLIAAAYGQTKTIKRQRYLSSCSRDFAVLATADRPLVELAVLPFELADELELPDESDSVDSESVSLLLVWSDSEASLSILPSNSGERWNGRSEAHTRQSLEVAANSHYLQTLLRPERESKCGQRELIPRNGGRLG